MDNKEIGKIKREVRREMEKEYSKRLSEIDICAVYPFNLIYEITDGAPSEGVLAFSPELISSAMATHLSIPEEHVLLGLYKENLTLDEVAKRHNVTRERIRQISERAKRKMKHPNFMNEMKAVSVSQYRELQEEYNELELRLVMLKNGGVDCEEEIRAARMENMGIDEMGFTIRVRNALFRAQIKTLGQLLDKTKHEIEMIRNLGEKGREEINDKLMDLGFGLKK